MSLVSMDASFNKKGNESYVESVSLMTETHPNLTSENIPFIKPNSLCISAPSGDFKPACKTRPGLEYSGRKNEKMLGISYAISPTGKEVLC